MSLIISSGSFGGAPPPPFQTSHYYLPHWAVYGIGGSLTLTANRLYRTWFYVDETTTFTGGWCANSGVGDNGVVLRIGVWTRTGTLKKDFGVVTLTGAAAVNSAANSVALQGPAWYQVGLVSSGTPALYTMRATDTSQTVTAFLPPLTTRFGWFSSLPSNADYKLFPVGEYAAFTYGALPDPITAATNTIFNTANNIFPAIGLYL